MQKKKTEILTHKICKLKVSAVQLEGTNKLFTLEYLKRYF